MDLIPDFKLYTDGSCNNFSPFSEGGSAYVLLDINGTIVKSWSKSLLDTTNNRAELYAVYVGLRNVPDGAAVVVYTDSKYCIKALTSKPRENAANKDLIGMNVVEIERLKQVQFEWVKGHNGNEYNELVDALANDKMEEVKDKFKIPTFGYREYKAPFTPQIQQRVIKFIKWTETNEDFKAYSDTK